MGELYPFILLQAGLRGGRDRLLESVQTLRILRLEDAEMVGGGLLGACDAGGQPQRRRQKDRHASRERLLKS